MTTTVEQWVPPECPQVPSDLPLSAVATASLAWVNEHIPFKERADYCPERAYSKGGNCFAQAAGGVAVLHALNAGAAIELTAGPTENSMHAHYLTGGNGRLLFIDPHKSAHGDPAIWNSIGESGRHGGGLTTLYDLRLARALETGDFVHYYYQPTDLDDTDWRLKSTTTIRANTGLTRANNPHIIVDGHKGLEMLRAIGDLERYRRRVHDNSYAEHYWDLIQFVPDFINMPVPSSG